MSYFWKNIIFLAIFHFSDVITECPSKNNFPEFVDCTQFNPGNYPVVQIDSGKVGGKRAYNQIAKVNVTSFLGIPFAEPPVGKLRFMASIPPKKFTKTYWGFNVGSVCIQTLLPPIGAEDCLFLNVYVPENCTPAKPCSVMIWIYGGTFIFGSGNADVYGPDNFMERGVIIVTFNYRLGPFGFLNTQDGNIPGNAGLLDQHLVIKWVNKNVAAFGGDVSSITIFGESAGAASVCYHCMSDASAGLFKRALMQSGSCLSDWTINYKPRDTVLQLAAKVGITSNNMTEVTAQLQCVPARLLAAAALALSKEVMTLSQVTPFAPSIDQQVPPFVSDLARNTVNNQLATNKPICHGAEMVSGINAGDGGFIKFHLLVRPLFLETLESNKEELIPPRCNLQPGSIESKAVANKIYNRYFSKGDANWNFYRYATSMFFLDGAAALFKSCIISGRTPFLYYFNYCGAANYLQAVFFPFVPCSNETIEAIHSDELMYEWTQEGLDLPGLAGIVGTVVKGLSQALRSPRDISMGKQIAGYFSNFAKYGTPNSPPPVDPLLAVKWLPATSVSDIQALYLGKTISMVKHPLTDEIDFWETACNPY